MADEIYEALLEMHFHRAIVECFEAVFGAKMLRLIKPSPGKEAWVGFDQGWVKTDVSTTELLNDLKNSIQSSATISTSFWMGYFLQFKRVKKMTRRSKYFPTTGFYTPYYRSELSLDPNEKTGLSQHETLRRLSGIAKTDVNYVCAIMDSVDEIYDVPDVDKLICVDVKSAPSGWLAGTRHFITIQNHSGSTTKWCSDPVPARAQRFREWAMDAQSRREPLSGPEAAALLDEILSVLSRERVDPISFFPSGSPSIALLPESFVLIEFQRAT